MKKRWLGILLTICMVLTLLPTAAWAEGETTAETVVEVGSEDALRDALGTADVVKLMEDITITKGLKIESTVTVDLNGYAQLELRENARITGCTATERDNTEAGTVEYGAAIYLPDRSYSNTYADTPGTFLYANGGQVEDSVYIGTNSYGHRDGYPPENGNGVKLTNAIDHTDGQPTAFTGNVYCKGDIRGGSFYGSVTVPDPDDDMSDPSPVNLRKFCSNLSGGSFYGPVHTECYVSGGTYYAGLTLGENAKLSGKPMDTGSELNNETNIPDPDGEAVTVTYDYGEMGGTYAEQIVQKGETAIQPADPKVNGFTFCGWYTDEACTDGNEYDFTALVTADITLYAKWEGTYYGIRITDKDGEAFYITDKNVNNVLGDGTVSYVPGYADADKTFTNDDWVRALRGETVEGLQLPKLALNGAELQSILLTGIRSGDADTVLLSTMLQIELVGDNMITCGGDGVDAIYAPALVISGRGSLNATATGQNAAAIAVDSEGGRYYQYGGDVTLYGRYSGIHCSDAYFEFADGKLTVSSPKSALYCDLDEYRFKITSDTTTFFCGISTEEAFEIQQPSVFENIVNRLVEENCRFVPIPERQTILYAQLTSNHTVTFDTDGGSTVDPQTVPYGKTAQVPAAPTKSGYTFDGWYLGDSKYDFDTTNVTADITLTAHWTPNSSGGGGGGGTYTLTFDTNGGSALSALRLARGSTVDLAQYVPERSGHVFTSWYADATLTQPIERITLSASTTVYAGWRAETNDLPFTDVSADAWYRDDVQYVYDKGLMTGMTADRFAPNEGMTRAMLVTVLWRQAGSPVVNYAMDFSDVAEGAWYAEAVRWAAAEGVVGGYGDGRFGPNDPITREQLATILFRHLVGDGPVELADWLRPYADADQISAYAAPAMQWAVGHEVLKGTATRAQVAAMLHRALSCELLDMTKERGPRSSLFFVGGYRGRGALNATVERTGSLA